MSDLSPLQWVLAFVCIASAIGFFAMCSFILSGRADDAMDRAFGDLPSIPNEAVISHSEGRNSL